jgi:methionyl-tRNA synthetase
VDETLTELKAYPAVISSSVERYRFREPLVLMNVARLGNKYLADEEPWKMIKRMKVVYKHKCMSPCKLPFECLCEPFTFTAKIIKILK